MLLAVLTISSCKKEPSACIDGPTSVAEGESATFTWCGENADDVSWGTNGVTGSGKSFTPAFPYRGEFTMNATGKNKKGSASAQIMVEYGKAAKMIAVIKNTCNSGNTNIPNSTDIQNYKAYLYTNRADWRDDLSSYGHSKAIDSVTCEYSTKYTTAVAIFTKSHPSVAGRIVSVEHRPPGGGSNISNWANIVELGATASYYDALIETNIDSYSKKLIQGKWKLTSGQINGNPAPISACNLDDYMKFAPGVSFAEGTWTYNVGPDNCGGTSLPSNGTFAFTYFCNQSTSFYLTNQSGPFTSSYATFNFSSIKVDFTSGSNSGSYTFNYQP